MNISDYNEKTRFLMPVGSALLKKDYYIEAADEYLHKYLAFNLECPLVELIHKDDRQEFIDAVEKLKDSSVEYVVVRFITIERNYRYALLRVSQDERVVDGFRYINVVICDMITTMEKYVDNIVNLNKYRRIMSLQNGVYFDYVTSLNRINIFMYANDKSYVFLSEDLEVWKDNMLEKHIWDDVDREKFKAVYYHIKEGMDNFKVQFSTTLFSKSTRNDSVSISGSTLFDYYGNRLVTGVIDTKAKITEQPYYTTEASKDAATGLLNKRAMMEFAAYKITEGGNKKLSLLVIDIDDFKSVNDNYGHLFGDKVIAKIAETIRRVVAVRGMVSRFGGDEFVVLLENCDEESLEYILKTIYCNVKVLFLNEKEDLKVTISTGIANYPEDGESYEELFLKADKALYIAKARGKNNYVIYNDKKHKDFEMNVSHQRMRGLKMLASSADKSKIFSDMILALNSSGKDEIKNVIKKISDFYDINGVSVFIGPDFECKYSYGKYIKKCERFELVSSEDYCSLFNENDVVVINNVKELGIESVLRETGRYEIVSTINCMTKNDNGINAVVTFDIFNIIRKWSEDEIMSLSALGKLIGQIVTR